MSDFFIRSTSFEAKADVLVCVKGASGAVDRADYRRRAKHANQFYEAVRKRKGDPEKIALNTGFSVEDVSKIREHLFINKYCLIEDEDESRFDPDPDQADSWQRLVDGSHIREMDIILLHHELMEYNLMNLDGMSYDDAHRIADKKYCYSKFVKKLDDEESAK